MVSGKNLRCALCNSDDRQVICRKAGLKRGPARDIVNVICNICGLIYNNPQPPQDLLREYYSGEFAEDKMEFEDEIFVLGKQGRREKKNKVIAEFLKPFLKDGGMVLDVGCSIGALLAEIKKLIRCATIGVEPDAHLARITREESGIERVENMFLEDFLKKNTDKFDLVILRHVLEHLSDPNRALENLKSILTADGFLFLVFPNAARFRASRSLDRNLEFGHLYTFTPFTIRELLLKHGMKVVKWSFDPVFLLQVMATRSENPIKAVSSEEMSEGSNIGFLKWKLKQHDKFHLLFRLKRKVKDLFRR